MEQTLGKISEISSRIKNHKEYSQVIHNKFISYLNQEALTHSVTIELRDETSHLTKKKFQTEKKNSLFNLKEASNFLETNGLSLYTLSMLGKKIDPKKNISPLRLEDIIYGDMFDPPSPLKLYDHLNNLVFFLKNSNEENPVIRATNAHLEMVEIHPFMDGNGRAGRLLQNYCLQEKGLPPAIISSNDSEFYRELINEVMSNRYLGKGSRFNPSPSEKRFQLYIATKVLNSLTDLETELSTKKNYKIILKELKDKEILFTVKKEITKAVHSQTYSGVKVSKNYISKNSAELNYQGKVGAEFFTSPLERLSKKYGFKYQIVKD